MSAREWGALDRLYRELPSIDCKGECHTSCGPIGLQLAEVQRIEKKLGGRLPRPHSPIDCPMLTRDKRCGVYAIRPLICRLWGVVEMMPCIYGCVPDRMLTYEEGQEFLRRAAAISPQGVYIGQGRMQDTLDQAQAQAMVDARG